MEKKYEKILKKFTIDYYNNNRSILIITIRENITIVEKKDQLF